MCRNIRTLFNFDPPATDEEIHDAALQFVRKLSGFHAPSKVNQRFFDEAVNETTAVARKLLDSLITNAEPHNRAVEAQRAQVKTLKRFGPQSIVESQDYVSSSNCAIINISKW